MEGAVHRLPTAIGLRAADNSAVEPRLPTDGIGLLDALPIAAAIFTSNEGKLWVEAMNARFIDLAGCHEKPEAFVETFKQYASGEGGAATSAFLADPASAQDEIEIAEGEGLSRRFLKLKLSPLPPSSSGAPR